MIFVCKVMVIMGAALTTRIKDAGIAIRHSQGYIISILQTAEMGWRGMGIAEHRHEKEAVPKKKILFCCR